MKSRLLSFLLLAACVLPGCATIISGTKDNILVTSNPTGAKFVVDGGQEYTTPAQVEVSRKRSHSLLVSMPGFHPEQVSLKQGFNGWVVGNILFGGIIGIVVDIASGATGDISPDKVHLDLVPVPPGQTAQTRQWLPPGKRKQPEPPPTTTSSAGPRTPTSPAALAQARQPN